MSCKVIFDQENKIQDVLSPSGQTSTLFKQIASLPFVNTLEGALETYKNTFSKKVNKKVAEQEKLSQLVDLYLSRAEYLKNSNPNQYWTVDIPSRAEVSDAVLNGRMVDVNGGMGIVTRDGNMSGMFKYNENSKGTAEAVQKARVKLGGVKLDNFDGYLTKLYEKNGFRVVSRVPFNKEHAPEGWNEELHGTPDVVYMIYDSKNDLNIEEKTFDDINDAKNYRDSFIKEKSLAGVPNIEGATGMDYNLVSLAKEYAKDNDIPYERQSKYVEVNENIAKKIAQEYENMKHNPSDPIVKEAYDNLIRQTLEQYKVLERAGYRFWLFDETNDPYNGSPWEAMRDLRENKQMGVFSTEAGYGNEDTELNSQDNPLLTETEFEWGYGSLNGEKRKVLANDLFRAVHDAFGHGLEGSGFRARGEENAWQAHSRLFTGSALKALTTETRGQNSWLNYGAYGEQNRTAKVEDTIFAEQKIGLMPDWTLEKDFSEEFMTYEPSLEFVSGDNTYSTYKEALLNSNGNDISVGITVQGEYKELYKASSNTNLDTVNGFINSYIKSDILSDTRMIDNGESFLRAEGGTDEVQTVNEFLIDEDAKFYLGTANRTVTKDGRITLREGKGKVNIETRNGVESIAIADFDSMSNEEIQLKFEDSDMILATQAIKAEILNRNFGIPTERDLETQLTENELQVRLLSLLEKMGVTVTSIEDYTKNYKVRNGVDISANALADISNQVIALKNGVADLSALTEETAHFIVEAWNPSEIGNLLASIDRTDEYIQFSDIYRELYKKQGFNEQEVEELVRKEILGKVLAKSLNNNFSTENKTDIETNIIDFIKNLVLDFLDRVNSLFKTADEIALNDFTNQVKDLVLNQNINNYLNTSNYSDKKFVMYQATVNSGSNSIDELLKQSRNTLYILQQQEKNLLKAGKGLRSNVKKLGDLNQQLQAQNEILAHNRENANNQIQVEEALIRNSFVEILSTAKRQAQYINQAADVANKNGTFLTNEEGIVFLSLKDVMSPTLAEMKKYLVQENSSENKSIIEEINNVIIEVSEIEGKMRTQDKKIINSIIDRMMSRHSLPESTRDKLEKATRAALQDTTAFYATFGQLSHARDPLLNLTGTIIHDLSFEANVNFLRKTKTFQSRIAELGFKEADLKQFYDNGYLIDIRDWSSFEKKESEISAQILKDVTGSPMSVEEIIKYKRDPKSFSNVDANDLPVIKTAEQNFNYSKLYKDAMRPYTEGLFEDGYYADEQKKYDKYKISDTTIRERRDLSIDRGTLISRVKDASGRIRYTNQDKIDLNAINIKRKKLKSLYNEFGLVKPGITVTDGVLTEKFSESNPDVIEVNGKIIELDRNVIGNEDSVIAFDLQKLDLIYQAEERENPTSLSQEFLDELSFIEQTEGRESALEFFRLNSSTNFSDIYWSSLDVKQSLADKLLGIPGAELLIEKLKIHTERRKQIVKQYQSQQDASNILVSEMNKDIKENVLELTDSIDELNIEASKLLREDRSDDEITLSEFTPNESYYNEIKGLNFQDKLDFILKNTSKANERRIRDFSYALDEKIKGKTLTESKQRLFDKYYAGNKEEALIKYAESKIALYYMRFSPLGYSQYQNRLENTQESVESIVFDMNLDDTLQITNNFSYYKAEEQAYVNKNYKQDFDGGYFQPKIDKFKNEKFDNLFQPNIVDGNVVSVSKNQNLYELYKEMMDYHKSSLSVMGELGNHNLWKAPQISKSGINKLSDFIKEKDKRGTIRESIKDLMFYRVDDQAYGAEINGESTIKTIGTRYIPKYYLRDLENPKDVSEDLFYSMSAFGQQAYLYESRKNYFSDMMAIQDSLLKREYPEGKSAESSSTVKMFKSYMDAYLFGVKESKQLRVTLPIIGQVDLTKNIRFLHTWILNRNLGFNLVIPFTSWVTAEASNVIEKYAKEYLNPYSTKLVLKEFKDLAKDAILDSLEVNSKAKLNVMLEHFGVYDITGRYENSIYSKTFRSIPKIGMILNEAANFPIIPRTALTVMYDYRVVGGDILNFNQYESIQRKAGVAKDQIISEWKVLEDKAFYNYMKVSETDVTYDFEKLREDSNSDLSPEAFKDFVLEKEKAITTRIREVVKVVDGQIPSYERSAAQRHFFLSFFTTHRGWLAIAYARRFKNAHLNIQTGQEEEGSYRTLGNFFQRNITGLYNNGFRSFLRDAKEDWDNASDLERNNMKRVIFELSFLQGMVAIGWVIAQMAADDDNKDLYALQLTNYLYFRLMNESTSSQVAIGGQFYDMIKSPIVGADTVKSIFSISNYYDTDKINTGRYAGMYKWQKQLMSVVPGYKSAIDIANPKDAYDSYKHFNQDVEVYNPALWALSSFEK